MVIPVIVTTNADADMAAPAAVMITEAAEVAPHTPVNPTTLLLPAATVGVTDAAKKAVGYVSVTVPPIGTGVIGVNPTVTGTADLPDMRSEVAMAKETADTRPIIEPDEAGADAEGSTDVCTKTATAPAVAAPIVKPLQCSA